MAFPNYYMDEYKAYIAGYNRMPTWIGFVINTLFVLCGAGITHDIWKEYAPFMPFWKMYINGVVVVLSCVAVVFGFIFTIVYLSDKLENRSFLNQSQKKQRQRKPLKGFRFGLCVKCSSPHGKIKIAR
jgi:hypothetical protein